MYSADFSGVTLNMSFKATSTDFAKSNFSGAKMIKPDGVTRVTYKANPPLSHCLH